MYIVDESVRKFFIIKGIEYTAYQRLYSDGDIDVEVYPSHDESLDVGDEAQKHAETIFEEFKSIA